MGHIRSRYGEKAESVVEHFFEKVEDKALKVCVHSGVACEPTKPCGCSWWPVVSMISQQVEARARTLEHEAKAKGKEREQQINKAEQEVH